MKNLLLIGFLFPALCQAQNFRVAGIADPAPAIITVVGTMPAFTTTQGSASTSGSVGVSGIGLSNDITISCPSGYQTSPDNSTWGTSTIAFTRSGTTASGTFWMRLAAATSVGPYNGNAVASSSPATPVNIAYTGTVNAVVVKDTALFQMDTTSAFNVAGWGHLTGDPSLNVKTATSGHSNSITMTTVATDFFHWTQFGACTGPNTGITDATIPSGATGIMKECYFNANGAYNVIYPQFQVSGLDPTKTYDIRWYATLSNFGLSTNSEFRVFGLSLQTMQTLVTQLNGSPTNTNPAGCCITLLFAAVQPDATGKINFYFNPVSGQQVASSSGITISQN